MWPILSVGHMLAGTIGARGPGSPPEERRHLALLGWVRQGTGGNSVLVASLAVNIGIVRGELVEGGRPLTVQNDRAGVDIIRVAPSQFGESALQGRARFRRH